MAGPNKAGTDGHGRLKDLRVVAHERQGHRAAVRNAEERNAAVVDWHGATRGVYRVRHKLKVFMLLAAARDVVQVEPRAAGRGLHNRVY